MVGVEKKMKRNLLILLIVAALSFAAAAPLAAQVTYDPNAEKFMLLSLNQSFINLGQAAKEFMRSKEQFENKLISASEFEQRLNAYRQAKISYDMALMRILFNASNVIVERAVKHVEADGKKLVTVYLKNEAGGSFELSKIKSFGARQTPMAGGDFGTKSGDGQVDVREMLSEESLSFEAAIKQTLPYLEGQGLAFDDVINLMEVYNIFISLKTRTEAGQDVMISKPYEKKIDRLGPSSRAQVIFELLRDVEICDVIISFGDKTITKPVYLELESETGGVEMTSEILSLQAELDSTATYNIDLQRFTSDTAFSLRVANIPREIYYNFIDPENNNQRIETVNFTEGKIRKRVQLQLTMPTRKSEKVQVDQTIPFTALVLASKEAEKFDRMAAEFGADSIPMDELNQLQADQAQLTITPLGVGEIEVSASTFYYAIEPDQQVEMTLTVKNSGTGELKNVQITADLPNTEWNYTIEPDLLASLMPESQEKVKIQFSPPDSATVGEHILKVKVEAKTRNQIVEADDKEVTVEIKEKPDIWGRLILIVLLIGIVLGIVIFGIKLSRR